MGYWTIAALWDDCADYRKALLNQGWDRSYRMSIRSGRATGRNNRIVVQPKRAITCAGATSLRCMSPHTRALSPRTLWCGPHGGAEGLVERWAGASRQRLQQLNSVVFQLVGQSRVEAVERNVSAKSQSLPVVLPEVLRVASDG